MTMLCELTSAYLAHAVTYYETNPAAIRHVKLMLDKIAAAVRLDMPVEAFGPKSLKAVRELMIDDGWSRGYVNSQTSRIRNMFKWGVGEELVGVQVHAALCCVDPLRVGHTEAREGKGKVHSAPQHVVDAILPILRTRTADMLRLQIATGMRPCEMVRMRPCDLVRHEPTFWTYQPAKHKTAHYGISRAIPLALPSIEILQRWMPLGTEERFFPIKTASYWMAISRACEAAGVEHVWPYQFRHSAATDVRAKFGDKGVKALLGHTALRMGDRYGEEDLDTLREIAKRVG